jgi:hypothetical protein
MSQLSGNPTVLDFYHSYFDKNGVLKPENLGIDLSELSNYIGKTYQHTSMIKRGPYLIIRCDSLPKPDERPFFIAGLVAIWLLRDIEYNIDIDVGNTGQSYRTIWLNDKLVDDLKLFVLPKSTTLSTILHEYFPDAIAVSYINDSIIVELLPTSEATYRIKLHSLPQGIESKVALKFHNGPIHMQDPEVSQTLRYITRRLSEYTRVSHNLLRSSDLKHQDRYHVDSDCFVNGSLKLVCSGLRVHKEGVQAIFSQEFNSGLNIREDARFSAVQHSASGKIVGVMHLQSNVMPGKLLCFADVLDQ